MAIPLRLLAASALLLSLAACNRQGPELPTAVDPSNSAADNSNGVDTVVVAPDAAFVGSAVDEQGDLATPQHDFAVGEKVYVSVPSKGRRLGDGLEVFWFHEDGKSRKDEMKKISGPFTAFEFEPSEAGKYNVEVDVGNRPIALVEFEVK